MTNEEVRVSVIIPVYNVEKYLHQCVDSVLNQTYKKLEVILVDDGSKDSSGKICDEYAAKDSRVVVIHKKNGGLSSARNAGMEKATGTHLMFLDSDDFWDSEAVLSGVAESLRKTDADVVCFGYREYHDGDNSYGKEIGDESLSQCRGEGVALLESMLSNGVFTSSACTKVVKRSLIGKDMMFVEGVTSEDIDWTARLLIKAKSFAVFPKAIYSYRQRSDSIVHTIKYENLEMLAENIEKCISYANAVQNKDFLRIYYNYISYQYISFLKVAILCEDDARTKPLLQSMKQYRWLLDYHLNQKVKIVYLFNKLLGYSLMFKALKLYAKVK